MPPNDGPYEVPAEGMSVGAVAARLGVSSATVRSWGTRYGLTPAERSAGGHRRYSEADVARLQRMQALVSAGSTPAHAAETVLVAATDAAAPVDGTAAAVGDTAATLDVPDADSRRRRPGGPGGRVLAVPNGSAAARGLARAAGRLDASAVSRIVTGLLDEIGARATWDDVLRPVLSAAGASWAKTGAGIEVEHLLSETIIDALRTYRARQPAALAQPPVLLAGSAAELHVLPLHVIAAALAELQVPTLLLGARVPGSALASAVRRTRASAVFLWRQQVTDAHAESAELAPMRPAVRVIVGGPGWDDVKLPSSVQRVLDLASAVTLLQSAATG